MLAVGLLALAPGGAVAATPQTSLGEVSSEVMCPVCGTLLELAESPQALRQKAFISRLVAEGRSKEQIKDALVAEYGTEVLALPQGSGFDLSAYLVPLVAFVLALIALVFGVLRWRRAAVASGRDGPAAGAAGPSDEDAERLDADLARYDL
jgi:cytochrome c-type biogenesis protein CcmH